MAHDLLRACCTLIPWQSPSFGDGICVPSLANSRCVRSDCEKCHGATLCFGPEIAHSLGPSTSPPSPATQGSFHSCLRACVHCFHGLKACVLRKCSLYCHSINQEKRQIFIKMFLFSFGLRLRKYHMSTLKNFFEIWDGFGERLMMIIEGILVNSH